MGESRDRLLTARGRIPAPGAPGAETLPAASRAGTWSLEAAGCRCGETKARPHSRAQAGGCAQADALGPAESEAGWSICLAPRAWLTFVPLRAPSFLITCHRLTEQGLRPKPSPAATTSPTSDFSRGPVPFSRARARGRGRSGRSVADVPRSAPLTHTAAARGTVFDPTWGCRGSVGLSFPPGCEQRSNLGAQGRDSRAQGTE